MSTDGEPTTTPSLTYILSEITLDMHAAIGPFFGSSHGTGAPSERANDLQNAAASSFHQPRFTSVRELQERVQIKRLESKGI